jgi:hypothetical protein
MGECLFDTPSCPASAPRPHASSGCRTSAANNDTSLRSTRDSSVGFAEPKKAGPFVRPYQRIMRPLCSVSLRQAARGVYRRSFPRRVSPSARRRQLRVGPTMWGRRRLSLLHDRFDSLDDNFGCRRCRTSHRIGASEGRPVFQKMEPGGSMGVEFVRFKHCPIAL